MDTSGINQASLQGIANTATQTGDAVALTVLKKAINVQEANAQQLIEAATNHPVPQSDPTSALGQNIDISV